jgi:uncharacterized protein (TIGR03435 family)
MAQRFAQGLILKAYNIQFYQLSGPAWINAEHFDIEAKIPEGATNAQFEAMQQNLLATRFGLTFHKVLKEMSVYELKVGKNGTHLVEWVEAPPPAPGAANKPWVSVNKAGQVVFAPGVSGAGTAPDGGAVRRLAGWPLERVASLLSVELGQPVFDETGVKGKYDMTLYYYPDATQPDMRPRTLADAMQVQLGLELERVKREIETLVIDHVDRTPYGELAVHLAAVIINQPHTAACFCSTSSAHFSRCITPSDSARVILLNYPSPSS